MYFFSIDLVILVASFLMLYGVFFVNYRFKVSFLSPAMFFIALHGASMVGGYFFYDYNAAGASVSLDKNNSNYSGVVISCLAMIGAFYFGALMVFLKCKNIKKNSNINININNIYVYYVVFMGLVVFIFGNGLGDLFYRRQYMVESNAVAKILGAMLMLAASFMLGLNYKKLHALRSIFLIILLVTIELSYSSRMSGVSLMLFGSGVAISGDSFKSKFLFLFSLIGAILCIHAALFMRGSGEQGLWPLINAVGNGDARGMWANFSISTIFNNLLLVNFAITSLTVSDAAINFNYIVTSLNPMPGFMTDWYSLESGINLYTPYSSMGELLNFSFVFSIGFYFLLGSYFAYLDVKSRANFVFYGMAGWALMNISALVMLQYSTRSSMRFFYYFLFLSFLRYVFVLLLKIKNNFNHV